MQLARIDEALNAIEMLHSEEMAKEIYRDIRDRSRLFEKLIETLKMQDMR